MARRNPNEKKGPEKSCFDGRKRGLGGVQDGPAGSEKVESQGGWGGGRKPNVIGREIRQRDRLGKVGEKKAGACLLEETAPEKNLKRGVQLGKPKFVGAN